MPLVTRPRVRRAAWVSMALGAMVFIPRATLGTAGAQSPGTPSASAGQQTTVPPASDYVGVASCVTCHEEQAKGYQESPHARAWDPRSPAAAQGCESCHGPGKGHLQDPGSKGRLRDFKTLAPRETSQTCMTCHNREEHTLWQGSMHDARNITCVNCHSVHTPKSERAHLKEATITATCGTCHRDKVAKLQRSAHMPVREGKIECTTCHNQHGSSNVRLLRGGNSVNEFCTNCHAEKRGPFLWDHPPVRDGCTTCHDPHGASNDRLLVAKAPMLCQRCHIGTGHPTSLYDMTTVNARNQRVIGRSCVNCHSQIHGSNHPSGQFFQR